jgi:hypothetical protein
LFVVLKHAEDFELVVEFGAVFGDEGVVLVEVLDLGWCALVFIR